MCQPSCVSAVCLSVCQSKSIKMHGQSVVVSPGRSGHQDCGRDLGGRDIILVSERCRCRACSSISGSLWGRFAQLLDGRGEFGEVDKRHAPARAGARRVPMVSQAPAHWQAERCRWSAF
jgi:hypothetical protein